MISISVLDSGYVINVAPKIIIYWPVTTIIHYKSDATKTLYVKLKANIHIIVYNSGSKLKCGYFFNNKYEKI